MKPILALLLSFLAALPLAAQSRAPITVIVVRHAEKATTPATDPPLSAEGERRARALGELARDAGINAIITTQYLRTRETARPAAEALHVTPEVVSAGANVAQEIARRIVSGHAGEVVLVVGHSNTVPAIVAALGAPEPAAICDAEYDGLYVVTVPASGPARLIRARYGQASPVTGGCGVMKP